MKCPFCKAIIDDDSWFCDQCGTALKFCPECRQPKRGTECAACGADLVTAEVFFNPPKAPKTSLRGAEPCDATRQPEGSSTEERKSNQNPTMLEGESLKLPLKEGVFGRTTGIYPELSSQIYISGQHGELRCVHGQWQIRDLGSKNGTLLNGMKLTPNGWYDLNIGDILKIATTLLTVK